MTNMFWPNAGDWKLVSGFYDVLKMTIEQYLPIFNSSHLPFPIVSYSPFQKNEALGSWLNWLLSNWGRLLDWKGLGTLIQSSKFFKKFLKIIALAYIHELAKFVDLMSCGSKYTSKNARLMY